MSKISTRSTFDDEVEQRISANINNVDLQESAKRFTRASIAAQYSYNFSWLGRPIIQYPQDVVAMQEVIWSVKPDLIIETGIAHGGSIVMSASMLALLEYCQASVAGETIDPANPRRKVLGIDIDIREHNRHAILAHPLARHIEMIQGSSVAPDVVEQVKRCAANYDRILVCLDSNHTHEHVLQELNAYAPLVSSGSYCIVFDTVVEDLPAESFTDRPWRPGNSPKSAVIEFLNGHDEFEIVSEMDAKLQISVAPMGYLRRR